jgi:uncharacterized damage-inducible protein DinB
MRLATYFRAQAYNNALANHRLLSACAGLDARALAAERTSFFPSIIRTLNHILTVDWFYVSSLEGASIGPAAFDSEIPHPEFAGLDRAQRAVDARLIAHCEDLDEGALAEIVVMDRGRREQRERRDRTLLHLFEHQIHHRGQVHAMLAGTAVAPPQLDEFFLDDERERSLRSDDFEQLGFSEDRIWR